MAAQQIQERQVELPRQIRRAPSLPHWIGQTCPRCRLRRGAVERLQGSTNPTRVSLALVLARPSLRMGRCCLAALQPPTLSLVVGVRPEPKVQLHQQVPIHRIDFAVQEAPDCPNQKEGAQLEAAQPAVPPQPGPSPQQRVAMLPWAAQPSFATWGRFRKWLIRPVVHPSFRSMRVAQRVRMNRSSPSSLRAPGCCCVRLPMLQLHRPALRLFRTGRSGSHRLAKAGAALPALPADHR